MDNTNQSTSEPSAKCSRMSQKKTSYLNWDDYFMAIASLSAMRSKDPNTQVGACIVNDKNIIVGVGYNGMPRGCSDDVFPWAHKKEANQLESKHYYVCHAEMNAIMNKNSQDLNGCTIYSSRFPCNECAKLIIQSGIKEVVYAYSKDNSKPEKAAIKMFDAPPDDADKVKYRLYTPAEKKILKSDEKVQHIHLTIETLP